MSNFTDGLWRGIGIACGVTVATAVLGPVGGIIAGALAAGETS